ncbi:hypothetical protein [Brucella anthropi]|uniref:hypothetical protein n=1 Tax=Brucella anthropi TaxID=529 RepID=UPI000F65E9A3|nr:hypothetical protein [Brucella anthropi]RRY11501.1 hypothetical protein EGJ58_07560 [Brucella anthropi]
MKQTWLNLQDEEITGRVEANVIPLVEAVGFECAATFLLNFGGSAVQFSRKASANNQIAQLIGQEANQALCDRFDGMGYWRVPIGNKFLARYLRSCGHNGSKIARLLRVTDASVRTYLMRDEQLRDKSVQRKEQSYLFTGGAV